MCTHTTGFFSHSVLLQGSLRRGYFGTHTSLCKGHVECHKALQSSFAPSSFKAFSAKLRWVSIPLLLREELRLLHISDVRSQFSNLGDRNTQMECTLIHVYDQIFFVRYGEMNIAIWAFLFQCESLSTPLLPPLRASKSSRRG